MRLRTPAFDCEIPTDLTLESVIDITGELEHLNELVMLHLKKSGGFQCPAAYFTMVRPILLDELEIEIRARYRPGMTIREMKFIVQDGVDREICSLK